MMQYLILYKKDDSLYVIFCTVKWLNCNFQNEFLEAELILEFTSFSA